MGYEHDDDELDSGKEGAAYPPQLKLPDTGNLVNFAVVNCIGGIPKFEFGTGEPKMNRRGKQKTATALVVLVLSGEGATIGKVEDSRPAVAGDVGTIWIESYTKFDPDQDKLGGNHLSWGGATDKLGKLKIGTVGQWKHLGELPSQGTFPRKNRKFWLRPAKPEEAEQTQRCLALKLEQTGEQPMAPASVGPVGDLF